MNNKTILLASILSSLFLFAEENNSINRPSTSKIKTLEGQRKKSYNLEEISIRFKKGLSAKVPLLNNIKDKRTIKKLYKNNHYTPLWIDGNGFNKRASSLFHEIEKDPTITKKSTLHQEYLYLKKYIKNIDQDPLRIEIKLSQLHLNFLKHTLYGSIKWKQFLRKLAAKKKRKIYGNWVRYKAPYNLMELIQKEDISKTIEEITPKNFGYQALLEALKKLETIKEKGGWDKLPIFKRLELGDQGDNVLKLRERLKKSNDLKKCEPSTEKLFEEEKSAESIKFQPEATFDECLMLAVKNFQKRHGLQDDGIVGPSTIRSMNETVEYKIQKVLLNLDRVKWLPRKMNKRYLIVNIPEYRLHYIEDSQVKEKIKVIVGNTKHPTPIFSNKISFIVLNPYWKVPEGIVKREIVPAMIKNPNYLRKQGLEIHETWSEYSSKISPQSIYWEQYADGYIKFPFRIMQPPGKKNALGKIKFKFPNRFDVYLHDTPTKYLFKKDKRAFSHGCVRVSEPKKLLATIATFNQNIKLKKTEKTLKGKRQTQINIKQKLPINILYLTAGFNAKTNEVEFRNDIYHYDKMQNIDKY